MNPSWIRQVLDAALELARAQELRRERLARAEKQSRARWDVLEGVGEGKTVPQVARRLGRSRQGVQVTADALAEAGLLRFQPNPEHRRSPVLHLTEAGRRVRERLDREDRASSAALAGLVEDEDLETAILVLRALRAGLES